MLRWKLIANHQDDWEDDTASDLRVLVGIFPDIFEEHGVTHSGEITQEHVAALRQHFNHILPLYGRGPRLRALSPAASREESSKRAEGASVPCCKMIGTISNCTRTEFGRNRTAASLFATKAQSKHWSYHERQP